MEAKIKFNSLKTDTFIFVSLEPPTGFFYCFFIVKEGKNRGKERKY
jgi:hypothetical protein